MRIAVVGSADGSDGSSELAVGSHPRAGDVRRNFAAARLMLGFVIAATRPFGRS